MTYTALVIHDTHHLITLSEKVNNKVSVGVSDVLVIVVSLVLLSF